MRQAHMLIDDITVGSRVRKDMGDLQTLAESMARLGMLEPIGVSSKGELVYGQRRLEAAQSLGWHEVPVVIIDMANPLQAERDENEERKDFTPSEKVAIARQIQDRLRAINEARRRAPRGARGRGSSWGDDGAKSPPSRAREGAAATVGMSPSTYEKARAVVEAAEADPSKQHLVDAMDRGELPVTTAHRKLIEKSESGVMRNMPGTSRRSSASAAKRLRKMADGLSGYAEALPNLDLRGEPVEDVLQDLDRHALAIRRAVKLLRGRA